MDRELLENLDNPEALEALFRGDAKAFGRALARLPEGAAGSPGARFWRARLAVPAEGTEEAGTSPSLLPFTLLLCLFSGTLLEVILGKFSGEAEKNLGFVVFPALCAFYLRKNRAGPAKYAALAAFFLVSALYINLLPGTGPNALDTLMLACIFLPLCLWSVLGVAHTDFRAARERRMDFLRLNGDLIVLGAVLGLAGGLLTGANLALFRLIDMDIEPFYKHVLYYGAASLPLAASYILETRRAVVSQVSAVVARIFSPAALATLVVYLVAVVVSGKNPYLDREYLIVFNFVLVAVLALVVFSSAGEPRNRTNVHVLLALALVAILLNGIALSAIIFRIAEFGTTPNRFAVLGSNLLIFSHVSLILKDLIALLRRGTGLRPIEETVTRYLPVYAAWSLIVVFLFPLVFRFI